MIPDSKERRIRFKSASFPKVSSKFMKNKSMRKWLHLRNEPMTGRLLQ